MDTAALAEIKLLAMDVDGVLTDGRLIYSGGPVSVAFDIHDGLGLKLAMAAGLQVVWITGRSSDAVTMRAEDLGIHELRSGVGDKLGCLSELLRARELDLGAAAYIGDDLTDIAAIEAAAFGVAVENAVAEVKAAANYVTQRPGGRGAVREVVELILKESGRWQVAPGDLR